MSEAMQDILDTFEEDMRKGNSWQDALRWARANAESSSAWQPIETVPADGTEFIAWFKRDSAYGDWEPRCRINEHGVLQIWGRVDYDQEDWDDYGGSWTITHWMPTPEPPNA